MDENTLTHSIVHADCLDVMQVMISGSQTVDCIITDPPYQTSNTNLITFKTRKNMSRDFGAWDHFGARTTTGSESYLAFIKHFYELAIQILKPAGNLVSFCPLEKIGKFIDIFEEVGFKHGGTIIWHKTNPAPRVRKTGFLSSCEAIVWAISPAVDDEKPTFNFLSLKEMHNFFESPICMGKERTEHETQKPRAVVDHLMKVFTTPLQVILDPFAGAGTVAESAAAAERSSMSIEKEARYFEIMKSRLLGKLPAMTIYDDGRLPGGLELPKVVETDNNLNNEKELA